jgi:hypothetical protein
MVSGSRASKLSGACEAIVIRPSDVVDTDATPHPASMDIRSMDTRCDDFKLRVKGRISGPELDLNDTFVRVSEFVSASRQLVLSASLCVCFFPSISSASVYSVLLVSHA